MQYSHARLQSCVILDQPKWDGKSSPEGGQHTCPISGLRPANAVQTKAARSFNGTKVLYTCTRLTLSSNLDGNISYPQLIFWWLSSDLQGKCKESASVTVGHFLWNPLIYSINHSTITYYRVLTACSNEPCKKSTRGRALPVTSAHSSSIQIYLPYYTASCPKRPYPCLYCPKLCTAFVHKNPICT
jgi:hypothetical protein